MIASPRNNWMIDGVQPVNWLCPLNRGLVAWWLGIPGWTGGRRLIDITRPGPNVNHGVLTNMDPAPDWVPSPRGVRALDFDGTDDKVLSPVPKIQGGTELTISAWINARSYGGGTNFGRVVSAEAATTWLILNGNGGDEGISFNVEMSGQDATAQGTDGMSLNEWHLVCGTRRVGEIMLYVDGVPTNKADLDTVGSGTIVDHSANTLAIGGRSTNNTRQFDGLIDDVRMYTRALSRSEVGAVYLDSLQGYPRTLQRIRRTIFAAAVAPPAGGGVNRVIGGGIII